MRLPGPCGGGGNRASIAASDLVLKSAISYTHVALQTAVILCLLSLGVVCARTERGVPALFVSGSVGGTLVRRLLPAAIVIPILIGALWWKALSAGLSSEWSGGTLMIVAMIALLKPYVFIGFLVDRADVERRKRRAPTGGGGAQRRSASPGWAAGGGIGTDKVTWSKSCTVSLAAIRSCPRLPEHSVLCGGELARLNAAVQKPCAGTPLSWIWSCPDGRGRSALGHGAAVMERDADGHVVLCGGRARHHRAQAGRGGAGRSADEIRDLYNHAPCGLSLARQGGGFVRINDTELEWLGYARAEVIGKVKFPDLLARSSRSRFEAEFARLKAVGAARDIEFDLVRKDGRSCRTASDGDHRCRRNHRMTARWSMTRPSARAEGPCGWRARTTGA
jgi:PAS domain S-box-containing protein